MTAIMITRRDLTAAELRGAAGGAAAAGACAGAGRQGPTTAAETEGSSCPTPSRSRPLPPYAPELNPVENVWPYLRANLLAISVFDGYDAIVTACCAACTRFADDPAAVASITSREWAQVNP